MKFSRVDWSEDAGVGLALAIKYANDGEVLEQQVKSGVSELWKADDNFSWLITRIEGHELVICCYQGRYMRAMFKGIYKHAEALGFHSVRIHTQQPWIIEVLRDYQPEPIEYVVRFFTNGWQKSKFYKHCNNAEHNQHSGHSDN